jgi:L-fuconolactonase
LLVVDSQVHIWDAGSPPPHHRQTPYGAEDLLADMDIAGVSGAVLVPPTWDPGGNLPSLRAAVRYPKHFTVMGLIDVTAADVTDQLRTWSATPGMTGVRLSFNKPTTRAQLVDGALDPLWAAAADHDVPLMILAPGLLPVIAQLARSYPQLRIIVDHLAIPRGLKGAKAFEHLPELLAIARYPNIAVKAAGIPGYSVNEPFPFASLHEPLRQVFEAFGPNRMFWGTDLSRMTHPYRECVEMFADGLPWLKGQDLASVMGGGLCRWIGWTAPLQSLHRAAVSA